MKAIQICATIAASLTLLGCSTIDDVVYHPVCASSPCTAEQLSHAVPEREVLVERHGWGVERTPRDALRRVYYYHSWLEYAEQDRRLFDPEQKRALLSRLNDFKRDGRAVYAVVYVHGWHNSADDSPTATGTNAGAFDSLMGRFADQLERRHLLDTTTPMPHVVGIYVGWRGESVRSRGLLRELSIADRAAAADRIGAGPTGVDGGLRTDLKDIAHALRAAAPDGKMVVIGHSLGGRMLTAAFLNDFVALGQGDSSRQPLGPGSAIVTVNAAVGADCFERLFSQGAPMYQSIPTWMNISSKDDEAVGSIYPLARIVRLMPACKSGSRSRTPIGHFAPFLTHTLQFQQLNKLMIKWPSSESEMKALGITQNRAHAATFIKKSVFDFGRREGQQITIAYPWIAGSDLGRQPAYNFDSIGFYTGVLQPNPLPVFPSHFWNVQTDRNTIDFAENGGSIRALHNGIFSTNLTRMLVDLSYAVP